LQNLVSIGKKQEKKAILYLEKNGYKILKTNYRTPFGELDIIAKDKDTIVFIEVKYRSTKAFGIPEEAVDIRKREHIIRSALSYLKSYNKVNFPFRFDVIAITPTTLRHYKDAFDAEGTNLF
jgi:putative endonuclease